MVLPACQQFLYNYSQCQKEGNKSSRLLFKVSCYPFALKNKKKDKKHEM